MTTDRAREDSRRPDGRFGEQPKADAGQLDLEVEWVQDGVTPHPTGGYVRVVRYVSSTRCLDASDAYHREDGPAIVMDNGMTDWQRHGVRHRDDGPAAEWPDGAQQWYVDGGLHREDGPAVIRRDGSQEWWLNNCRHRSDGPAIIRADGSEERWIHGEQVDVDDD